MATDSEFVTCPRCGGRKRSTAFVDGYRDGRRFGEMREIDCGLCGAAGVVTREVAARLAVGASMRRARVDRGETMGDVAARLGLSVVTVSHAEHGGAVSEADWELIRADARACGWREAD